MDRCVLCGSVIEENCLIDENSDVNDFKDLKYCRACKEVLKIVNKKDDIKKNKTRKVNINSSDYYLPGFKFSKEKNCFVKEED